MSTDIVVISDNEIADPADITRIGEEGRRSIDGVTIGGLGWTAHHSRFTVSSPASDLVRVSPGDLYASGVRHQILEPVDKEMQTYKPLLSQDERWVALILRGVEIEETQTRAFETSVQPLQSSEPVDAPTVKYRRRRINVVPQLGPTMPAPAVKPTIDPTDCCLAFVLLKSSGVVAIVPNETARAKTVMEIEGRLSALEIAVEVVSNATKSLATDLSSVWAAIKEGPDPRLVRQLVRDQARDNREKRRGDARNYFFDNALTTDIWDLTHPLAAFRIQEGIRFPSAAVDTRQLRLFSPGQPGVAIYDNTMVMPEYQDVVRIENGPGSSGVDIAGVQHTTVTAHQQSVTYESIRYGETVYPCQNTAGWEQIPDRRPGETFAVNGQEFVSLGVTDNPWNQTEIAQQGHQQYAAQRVIRDYSTATYTTYTTESFGINGAIHGQTLVADQLMVNTFIDLFFTRVDTSGDAEVMLCVCRQHPNGSPDFNAVIARKTLPSSQLRLNDWTRFHLPWNLWRPSDRLAAFTVTKGNHRLATTDGNAYTGGSRFVCTDGVWSQLDTTSDLAMRVGAARYLRSRTEIPMNASQVTNGMTEIQWVYRGWEPEGTRRQLQVLPDGAADYIEVDGRDPNPLAGLPSEVRTRMIMSGTLDVQPMIILDQDARMIGRRAALSTTAVSKLLTFGFSTSTLSINLDLDSYDAAFNTAGLRLLRADNSVITPTGTIVEEDPLNPARRTLTANFNAGAAIGQARMVVDATTTAPTRLCFGESIQLNAF